MIISALELSKELVNCPSITPRDEGALHTLEKSLRELGFTYKRLRFGEVDNLFARLGEGGPHLCFCGHTDVVPPGDESKWTSPPFKATVRDGKLYGRGTADMKCNIAAFVEALSSYIAEKGAPQKGSISLLITGDEEGLSVDGTVKVLQWMDENNQLANDYLVGEPSNPSQMGDEIKIGRRGSLNGYITVNGTQGHVAYPARADNPLPKMLKLLSALNAHEFDKGTPNFQPTNLEITSIDTGNMADNVIPGEVRAKFNVRFNDRWNAQRLDQEIRKVLDSVNIPYNINVYSNAPSFLTAPGALTGKMLEAVREVTGRTPQMTTGGGTSDARFCAAYGPVVEFGLINSTIHKVDEHVALDDLQTLVKIYRKFLDLYFS